jgi:D-aminopeptidase
VCPFLVEIFDFDIHGQSVNAVTASALDILFRAASDATEEAHLNALLAADELDGYSGQRWRTVPVQRVLEILKEAGRLTGSDDGLEWVF